MKKKMTIPSVSDLETLSTGELADLLGNVVLLLRRLPDVPLTDVINGTSTDNGHEPKKDPGAVAARMRRERKQASFNRDTRLVGGINGESTWRWLQPIMPEASISSTVNP
jgi:hypothetical protein